jgi:hypothetical protein
MSISSSEQSERIGARLTRAADPRNGYPAAAPERAPDVPEGRPRAAKNLRFTLALLLALCLALAACGDDDSGDSGSADSAPAATQEDDSGEPGSGEDKATKEKEEPNKQEAIAGLSDVQECLEGLGFQLVRYDKNSIRVTGDDGSPAANIDIYTSEQAAQKAYAQLDVKGAQGGQFTVTYNMGGTDDTERAVIGECVEKTG